MTDFVQRSRDAATHDALAPSADDVDMRYQALVDERYAVGTRSWRSARTTVLLTPLFLANALLPALPTGFALSRVSLETSLAIYGTHYVAFVAAAIVFGVVNDIQHPLFRIVNRAESAAWIVGSGLMVGLSGTAASVYWLHIAMVVTLVFPMIRSHRSIAGLLLVATTVATMMLAATASLADGLFGAMVGATLLLFHTLSMRTAPRMVRAQATADALAARATEVIINAERERIRRELHDNLGAELTSLLWAAQASTQADAHEVDALVGRIRSGIAELRVVMHAVARSPMPLARLERELKRVADRITPAAVHVDLRTEGEASHVVPGEVCHAAIRITQECVRNAVEHGDAQRVELALSMTGSVLTLAVADDGAGLRDADEGSGMRGIRLRAAELGGDATWASGEPGVRIQVTLPLADTPSASSGSIRA